MPNPLVERYDVRISRRVLVTGRSNHVGSRLAPEFLESGHTVRCVVRHPRMRGAASNRAHPAPLTTQISSNEE